MKRNPPRRKLALISDGSNYIERLNRALPPLPDMNNGCLLPNESAQMYYVHMEPSRRICEARTVLRGTAGGEFDIAGYLAKIIENRGKDSAIFLKNDLVKLFTEIIQRDPSLRDLLHPQLKQLIQCDLENSELPITSLLL